MDLLSFASEIINIPSVTGNEKALAERLEEHCIRLGFHCEREYISENRWNLYVNWNDKTDVVFCTHMDTVPKFYPAKAEGDWLYGRGACDAKGIIASMLFTGKELLVEGENPSFLFVVGEETDSIGAKTAVKSGKRARYIIVGEPTENLLAKGQKGALSYTITTRGKAAHSAYPEKGSSAIHKLLDMLNIIRNHEWGNDPILGKSTLNIGFINGGIAANVFAPEASATVLHRLVDSLDRRKEDVLSLAGPEAEVTFHVQNNPQSMFVLDDFETTVVSFGTDVPYLKEMGVPLLIGPGSIHDAHTDEERISIQQMRDAVGVYKRLYYKLIAITK